MNSNNNVKRSGENGARGKQVKRGRESGSGDGIKRCEKSGGSRWASAVGRSRG